MKYKIMHSTKFIKFTKLKRILLIGKNNIGLSRYLQTFDSQKYSTYFEQESLPKVKPIIYVQEYKDPTSIVNKIVKKTLETTEFIKKKFLNFVRYARRIFMYFLYGTPAIGLYTIHKLSGSVFFEKLTWDYTLFALNKLGPFFIKLGQWASTRPDLFSDELILKLESLQDNVKVDIDFNAIELHLEQLLGPTWKNNLSYEIKPLGIGSIGSVLKGKIEYEFDAKVDINIFEKIKNYIMSYDHPTFKQKNIKHVAIKTIHSTSKELVQIDMELLKMFANYLDTYPDLKMLAFGETLRKFSNVMIAQLNLNNEGINLIKFNNNFKNCDSIKFPEYIASSENVLIESFIDGIPLKLIMKDKKYENMYESISNSILDGVIKQVFADNFIHGDLHPGNILIDITNKSNPIVCMLDCGIAYEFENKKTHQKIANICFLLMKHKGYNAGLLLIDDDTKIKLLKLMEKYKNNIIELNNSTELKFSQSLLSAHQFCKNVQDIVSDSEKENAFKNASSYTERLIKHAKKCGIILESDILQLILASKVVEGIFLGLTPNMTLISSGIPKVMKYSNLSNINLREFTLL